MKICGDRINFADVENTITYSLCPDKLEKNLNKREDELCNKISDLEAKLAESEKSEETYKSMFEIGVENNHSLLKEIEQLKQQLAEKDEEIENIKLCRCVNCKNEYEFMLEGLVEDLEKQIDKDDQDKISFAITQLEKIKDKFREIYDKNRKHHLSVVKCYELVDEQIAELSNENKGKGE